MNKSVSKSDPLTQFHVQNVHEEKKFMYNDVGLLTGVDRPGDRHGGLQYYTRCGVISRERVLFETVG